MPIGIERIYFFLAPLESFRLVNKYNIRRSIISKFARLEDFAEQMMWFRLP